jgi:hypothetical protein
MEENRVIAMNDAPLVPENYIDIHEGIVKLLALLVLPRSARSTHL